MKRPPQIVRFGIYGLFMGFALSRMGFSDFAEAHYMFTLTSLRLFLAFAGGVGLIGVALFAFYRFKHMPAKPLHKGSAVGGVLFGAGWAITGACPSVVLIQLGEGQLAALATLVGVVIGTWLYPRIHRRFFGWDMGACGF